MYYAPMLFLPNLLLAKNDWINTKKSLKHLHENQL